MASHSGVGMIVQGMGNGGMQEQVRSASCWLLSAYAADSHRAWADWLVEANPQYAWSRLELPGRHFRWRIRGNPLSWLDSLPSRRPSLIVATSMVDIATLRGLHRRIAAVPALYYFHENQFGYPRSEGQSGSVDPQMVQLYGALAADCSVFNSAYNRDSFLDGVAALMAQMPDRVPQGLADRLRDRAQLCPVPVRPIAAGAVRDPRLILWNHRWEYDKAPEILVEALGRLRARGVGFRLALLGKRPARIPEALRQLRSEMGDRVVADGHLDRDAYARLLGTAAIAVSTAIHEFQGVGMLEACSAGARPLVPDALCYREQYPAQYRYPAGSPRALADRLADWLERELPAAVDVSAWYPEALSSTWRGLLDGVMNRGQPGGQANDSTNRLNSSRPMPM